MCSDLAPRGLHVVVALRRGPDYAAVNAFAREVAAALVETNRSKLTTEFRIADGKSYPVYQRATELEDLALGTGNGDGQANRGGEWKKLTHIFPFGSPNILPQGAIYPTKPV